MHWEGALGLRDPPKAEAHPTRIGSEPYGRGSTDYAPGSPFNSGSGAALTL